MAPKLTQENEKLLASSLHSDEQLAMKSTIMDDKDERRKALVGYRHGFENFRSRATIPVCDDESLSLHHQHDSSRLSALSQRSEEDDDLEDTRRLSTMSEVSVRRQSIYNLLKQAAHAAVVSNILLSSQQKSSVIGEADVSLDRAMSDITYDEPNNNSPIKSPLPIATTHPRNAGKYTVIAFVNSTSGGGKGDEIYKTLQTHLGNEYVIDLHSCGPGNMPEDTLLKYAHDPFVRVLACGGDGTCGWIYSSLDQVWSTILGNKGLVHTSQYKDHLPLAIMPLGTGNDLSRQYHWGPSFQNHMKQKSMISAVESAKLRCLDRWRCLIMPMSSWGEKEKEFIPQILAERNASDVRDGTERTSVTSLVELEKVMGDETDKSPKKGNKFVTESNQPSTQYYDGLFCNYFSLGFDATVLYLFHCEREENPGKFSSPLKNKLVYVEKSPYGVKTPKLKKRIDIFVNNEKGDLVKLKIPKDTRALVSFLFGHSLDDLFLVVLPPCLIHCFVVSKFHQKYTSYC